MTEAQFLALARDAASSLGFGRMMQIISHLWYRSDPIGAQTIGRCYAQLPARQQRDALALAEADPLFSQEPAHDTPDR